MNTKMIAHVFGKQGCAKCDMLKRRLGRVLSEDRYSGIVMEYHDVMTEEGLVDFCRAEVLNPNRIPALLVSDAEGNYIFSRRLSPEDKSQYDPSSTVMWTGIQTDYDGAGRGVITEDQIRNVLEAAL